MCGEVIAQEILVAAQPEEPVSFLDPFQDPRGMQYAAIILDLAVGLERFAADAVPSRVRLLVEVVRIPFEDPLDERVDTGDVLPRCRADELIVRDAEPFPHGLKALGDPVDERLWRHVLVRRGLGDLLAVFIHPDEEMDVIAAHPAVARDDIGADFFESVAEVWVAVGVVDCGGEVEHRAQPGSDDGGPPGAGPLPASPRPPSREPPPGPGGPPRPRPRRPPRRPRRRWPRASAGAGDSAGSSPASAPIPGSPSSGSCTIAVNVWASSSRLRTAADGGVSSPLPSPFPSSFASGVVPTRPADAPSGAAAAAMPIGSGLPAASNSSRSAASGRTRDSPSLPRSVTRSLKMSLAMTFSSPRGVMSVLPSLGKRLRLCT